MNDTTAEARWHEAITDAARIRREAHAAIDAIIDARLTDDDRAAIATHRAAMDQASARSASAHRRLVTAQANGPAPDGQAEGFRLVGDLTDSDEWWDGDRGTWRPAATARTGLDPWWPVQYRTRPATEAAA